MKFVSPCLEIASALINAQMGTILYLEKLKGKEVDGEILAEYLSDGEKIEDYLKNEHKSLQRPLEPSPVLDEDISKPTLKKEVFEKMKKGEISDKEEVEEISKLLEVFIERYTMAAQKEWIESIKKGY